MGGSADMPTRRAPVDHLGTLRDIADLSGSTVSITNHRDYNSFGSLTSEANTAVDLTFGFTSRPWDDAAGSQNNLNRWLGVVLRTSRNNGCRRCCRQSQSAHTGGSFGARVLLFRGCAVEARGSCDRVRQRSTGR